MTIGIGGFLAGIASLPMYDFAELRVHTDLLWTAIAAKMRSAGVDDVPDDLTRPEGVLVDHWRRTELLFSQTCGYPLVRDLPNAQVLGSFSVSCGTERPGFYRSVLVARSNDPRTMSGNGVGAFDGARLAANDHGSLSGWVSLGCALAESGVTARSAIFTGQHALSVLAVRDHEADLASIDAHSFALFARHRPTAIEGLTVIGYGPEVAVTPLITNRAEAVETLRTAVAAAVEGLPAEVLRELMITGWIPHGRAEHEHVKDLARRGLAALPTA